MLFKKKLIEIRIVPTFLFIPVELFSFDLSSSSCSNFKWTSYFLVVINKVMIDADYYSFALN